MAAQSDLQQAIHEPHADLRERIILDLYGSAYQLDRDTAFDMAGCADTVRFYIDPDQGKVRPWLHRCRKRLCPLCGANRSAKAAHDIHLLAATMLDPRHLILTLKSTDEDLGTQVDRLIGAFRKLRRTKLWETSVKGGIGVTEVTWNPRTAQWHPHLHILYDGSFIVHKLLAAEWAKATDGSYIVWIRRVDNPPAIAAELSKYIAKPANLKSVPPGRLSEYNRAAYRRRMLTRFGTCYGIKLHDTDPLEPLGPNKWSVSINRLMFLARRGADTPQRLLVAIASRYPTMQSYIYHAMPQLDPPEHPTQRTLRLLKRLVANGEPTSPTPSRSRADDEALLDARLFIAFTRYRQEADAGRYMSFDDYYVPP